MLDKFNRYLDDGERNLAAMDDIVDVVNTIMALSNKSTRVEVKPCCTSYSIGLVGAKIRSANHVLRTVRQIIKIISC